jgi:hypothetical protein
MNYSSSNQSERETREILERTLVEKKLSESPEDYGAYLEKQIDVWTTRLQRESKDGSIYASRRLGPHGWEEEESESRNTLRLLLIKRAEWMREQGLTRRPDPLAHIKDFPSERIADVALLLLRISKGLDPDDLEPHQPGAEEHKHLEYRSASYREIVWDENVKERAARQLQEWESAGIIDLEETRASYAKQFLRTEQTFGPRPVERLLRNPRDAELVAVEWMRYWGFRDARATSVGADEGIDVMSEGAVAQVKAHMIPTGRPDLQNLAGIAAVEGKEGIFFSLNGYSAQAIEWGTKAKIALFTFDLQGVPEAANSIAREFDI